MLKRYREMVKKVLKGQDVENKVKEQEAKLYESKKILEEKRKTKITI